MELTLSSQPVYNGEGGYSVSFIHSSSSFTVKMTVGVSCTRDDIDWEETWRLAG